MLIVLYPQAVKALGATVPWETDGTMQVVSPKLGFVDSVHLRLFDAFARATFTTGFLRLILPDGRELR